MSEIIRAEEIFFERNKKQRKDEVKVSITTNFRNKSNTRLNIKQCAQQKKKRFQDVTNKPTTDEPAKNLPTAFLEPPG